MLTMTKFAKVMDAVDVKHTVEHELTLEWESSASNDMIADATLAVIAGMGKSPASVQRRFSVVPIMFPLRTNVFIMQ
jgi:hypothetical protein